MYWWAESAIPYLYFVQYIDVGLYCAAMCVCMFRYYCRAVVGIDVGHIAFNPCILALEYAYGIAFPDCRIVLT